MLRDVVVPQLVQRQQALETGVHVAVERVVLYAYYSLLDLPLVLFGDQALSWIKLRLVPLVLGACSGALLPRGLVADIHLLNVDILLLDGDVVSITASLLLRIQSYGGNLSDLSVLRVEWAIQEGEEIPELAVYLLNRPRICLTCHKRLVLLNMVLDQLLLIFIESLLQVGLVIFDVV